MIKKIISLLAAAAMLPLFGVSALAIGEAPRVTGGASDPLSGYYVVYEYNGSSYRSDEMGPAFNRNMWRLLDDNERQKVVSTLSYRGQRVSQFGVDGNDMIMDWYSESNEWSKAKRQWEQKLSGKHFPELEGFYSGSLSENFVYYNEFPSFSPGRDRALYDEFYETKTMMNDFWRIGAAAYGVLGKLKGKQVAVAVNFGSMEIIKMLSDTYFMPAATRGAKPLSDALSQAFGLAADQGMGMLSAPPPPGEQIASVENLINECKTTAETVMNDKLPAAENKLLDLLTQIEQDRQRAENEYQQRLAQEQEAAEQRATQVDDAVAAAYDDGVAAIEETVSLTELLNRYVPKKGDAGVSASDYIEYRNWAISQITALMTQIRTELAALAPAYQALRDEYAGYEQAILDSAGLADFPNLGSQFLNSLSFSSAIYNKRGRFYHPVAGMPYGVFRPMIETTAEAALQDFSTDLFTYYGYAENIPYFALVRGFFDEDRADYRSLIEDYGDFAAVVQSALENENELFAALSDLKGRLGALRSQITTLEGFYKNRTDPFNFGWYTGVDHPTPFSEFFSPLYPAEYPAADIAAFVLGCRGRFGLFYEVWQLCLKTIEQHEQSLEDLDLIEANYLSVLNEYIDTLTVLAARHQIVSANYENALSQVYSSIKGVREAQSAYFQSASAYTSYYYDGKYYNEYNAMAYPSVDMSKIQRDISGGAQRQNIINELKALKAQEEAHLRRFETAKAHQNYYAGELLQLSYALKLGDLGHRASLFYVLGRSDIKTPTEIVNSLFPNENDWDLVTLYTVSILNGSNLHHAIEMLEGKTENYYKLQHYKDKISGLQGASSKGMLFAGSDFAAENTAKSVYKAASEIFERGLTSTITYAQTRLQQEYFAVIDNLAQTGFAYTEAPQPTINLAAAPAGEGKIAVTVENASGGRLENAFVIFAEYSDSGALLGSSFQKVMKIENLYADTKIFSANERAARFKVMLWEDAERLSPLTDALDGAN